MSPKRADAHPQRAGKKARRGSQGATATEQAHDTDAVPVVVLAGRTQDPEGVGAQLVKLLGGNAAAVHKGIRKTDEVPPRYAIPDVIEMVKGPPNPARELTRLRERYPEVFAKERDRLRERQGDSIPNWYSVRFRDSHGRTGANTTPVATIHGKLEEFSLLSTTPSVAVRAPYYT